jgi:ABC-type branched-subunit amino acid transport system ATPase component/MFS family permease
MSTNPELDAVRAGEAAIEEMERDAMELARGSAAALGVGTDEPVPTFRRGLRDAGVGRALALRVAVLTMPLMFLTLVLLRFDSAIANTLGLDPLGYEYPGLLNSLEIPVYVVGAVGSALLTAKFAYVHACRGWVLTAAVFLNAVALWCCAFATGEWGLLVGVLLAGLGAGAAYTTTFSMVMDGYPPGIRVRVVTLAVSGVAAGAVVGNVVVALGYDAFDLTWRGILMVLAALGTLLAAASIGVRDPGVGRFDVDRIDEIVRERIGPRGTGTAELSEGDVSIRFSEQLRQVFAARAGVMMAAVFFLFGTLVVPLQAFISQFVVARYQWTLTDRLWFYVLLASIGVLPLFALATRGDRWFRAGPERLMRLVTYFAVLGCVALFVVAFVTNEWVTIIGLALAYLGLYFGLVVAYVVMLSVVEPRLRAHAAAVAGLLVLSAVLAGGIVAGQLSDRYGVTTAIVFFSLSYLGVAGSMRIAGQEFSGDVATLVEKEIQREELVVRVSTGQHFPLLGCRNLDFSYGKLQVLFGVDFTVDDGELVALLGTNGAGKSTLLKVISGLGLPSRGSVHFRGADITYVDPVRRVEHGIAQMPGGRAVFPGMTVAENLRMHGFAIRKTPKSIERGIDATFDAFPVLYSRRNQPAATLSGGEQQMLALGKAFILQPRLLLIDELSLGLAPLIVGQLIAMVQRINASGTAVVVVEQSVNIALTLVDHAYFMERGQMRFDGVANELIERPDLLRSVFLDGASKGLQTMAAEHAREDAR